MWISLKRVTGILGVVRGDSLDYYIKLEFAMPIE